jgi:hypothetical protein
MASAAITRPSVRWLAPALLAISFVASPAVNAAELASSAGVVAPPAAPTDSREAAVTVRERSSLSTAPDQAAPGNAPAVSAQELARLARPPVRARKAARRDEDRVVRRDEDRVQVRYRREAAAIPWHRSGMGVVLGVGF